MKKFINLLFAVLFIFTFIACSKNEAGSMKPGTYLEVTTGMYDGLNVEVVLGAETINDVIIKKHKETIGIADAALVDLPKAIVESQSIDIDTISGATRTSEGILLAVEQAILSAGGDPKKFKVAVETTSIKDAPLTDDPIPTEWDMAYDVVVVGAGFAGLAATHSAQENGANTILVEKMPMIGGQSAINGGQYAAYTSDIAAGLQEKFNLEPDTASQHIEDTLTGGDNMNNPELVEVMVYGSPIYFNKLLENGLVVRDTLARPGGHYGFRTYVTENSIGADIVNLQEQIVRDSGAEIKTNTKMVQLFREDDGRVVGIQVATNDGLKTIKAKKGVILTTGGFSSNKEMRQKYNPSLTPDMPTTNNVSSTGEGLVMAEGIGAATMQLGYIQRYPWANPNTGVLDTPAVIPFTGPSYGIVYVDQEGNRYVNEGDRRDVCANAAIETGGTSTFSIFNRDVVSFSTDKDLESGIASGRIYKADTIEELVEIINSKEYQGVSPTMDAATLQATIARHNGFIDSKVDEDFNKIMADSMVKIDEGPYYAIPQWPSVHHTMGGLAITPNAEVIDIDGSIIPGLFAAGEVTGGIHGTNRLGSNADADACTFGFVAGTYAATETNPVVIP